MAKFFRQSVVTVVSGWYGEVEHRDQQNHVLYTSTWFFRDDDTEPEEYSVRSLGRGRWLVETETGWSRFMRTAQLERFFSRRPDYEKVYVTKA